MKPLPAVDTVIHNIGTLVTPGGESGPLRGQSLALVQQTGRAAIAIRNGRVVAAGREADVRRSVSIDDTTRVHDARGLLAVPGLVDCHNHTIFAGDRAGEFDLRNRGASYEELHAAGGGIHATVTATREAIADATLAECVRRHLDWVLAAGTTTTEMKSGYALTAEGEIACLRVAREVADSHPVRAVGTLLAAHTVPEEYGEASEYIDEVALRAVDTASQEALAVAADVFLERGSFDRESAARYLRHARERGLAVRLHTDQFSDLGGIELALQLGARSVDHLEVLDAASPRLSALAESDVAAVVLPLSSLFLRAAWAPARELVDRGAIVAVASDFNPGSSYGESLTLAMTLACTGCGLTAIESFNAVTANAAWVLGLSDVGRIAPGYRADLLLVDQPDVRHLAYHAGTPGIDSIMVSGEFVPVQMRTMSNRIDARSM